MSSGSPGPLEYAEPRAPRIEDCFFYHVMDLPGVGRVGEQWDLRDTVDAYLGGFDFRGQRVLDVGAWLLNAYWFAHRALGSSARACHGNIYDIPQEIGPFDVVVLGSILLHLRDPFRALWSATRLARRAVIVVDLYDGTPTPTMTFLPSWEAQNADTWWSISEPCMTRMIEVMGFETPVVTRSSYDLVYGGQTRPFQLSTYVAHRRAPL